MADFIDRLNTTSTAPGSTLGAVARQALLSTPSVQVIIFEDELAKRPARSTKVFSGNVRPDEEINQFDIPNYIRKDPRNFKVVRRSKFAESEAKRFVQYLLQTPLIRCKDCVRKNLFALHAMSLQQLIHWSTCVQRWSQAQWGVFIEKAKEIVSLAPSFSYPQLRGHYAQREYDHADILSELHGAYPCKINSPRFYTPVANPDLIITYENPPDDTPIQPPDDTPTDVPLLTTTTGGGTRADSTPIGTFNPDAAPPPVIPVDIGITNAGGPSAPDLIVTDIIVTSENDPAIPPPPANGYTLPGVPGEAIPPPNIVVPVGITKFVRLEWTGVPGFYDPNFICFGDVKFTSNTGGVPGSETHRWFRVNRVV